MTADKRGAAVNIDGAPYHPDAACLGHDPTLWDVDHSNHAAILGRCAKCMHAVAICRSCPVRAWCQEQAARQADIYTIRGAWALVPDAPRRQHPQAVPASACGHCRLPVLRRPRSGVLLGRLRVSAPSARPPAGRYRPDNSWTGSGPMGTSAAVGPDGCRCAWRVTR